MGASLALTVRASRPASTFARLSVSNRFCSKSSRANACTTRMEVSTSSTIDNSSLSFLRTAREAFLMRRV
jgi:hypothetical protein